MTKDTRGAPPRNQNAKKPIKGGDLYITFPAEKWVEIKAALANELGHEPSSSEINAKVREITRVGVEAWLDQAFSPEKLIM